MNLIVFQVNRLKANRIYHTLYSLTIFQNEYTDRAVFLPVSDIQAAVTDAGGRYMNPATSQFLNPKSECLVRFYAY